MERRAVILLSGGLDSAVALAAARREGFACFCLSFDYGQRHRWELHAAATVARAGGATDHRVVVVDLRAIGGSALTDEIDIPRGGPDPAIIPVTYVPARNLVFLSLGAAYAETVNASDLYIGVNAVDYSGYPDCRREFIDAFERAAGLGTKAGVLGQRLRVQTPLVSLSKAGIIRLGASLGVDFGATHSCYDPGPGGEACGGCDSCILRRRGFDEAGVADPTRYGATRAAAP